MLHYLSQGKRDYFALNSSVSTRSGWEFQAVLEGSMTPRHSNTKYDSIQFKSNYLWIFPPGMPHGWMTPQNKPCQIMVIHVDTEDIPAQLIKYCQDRDVLEQSLTQQQTQSIGQLTTDLMQHYPKLTNLTGLYTQRLVMELSLLALKDQSTPIKQWTQHYNEQRVRVAITWFSQHMNQHVGVSEMAQAAGVSAVHLRRLFKETGNLSPLKTINTIRLERARHLLRDTSLTLSEIADAIGISGATVFCRWFKQATEQTPIAWREDSRKL